MSVKRYTSRDIADAIVAGEAIATDEFVRARDYDALSTKHAHALAIERGKLEKADAENERLTARIDDLEAAGIHTHNGEKCRHLACVNDRLKARVAELEKDAARYRFIRQCVSVDDPRAVEIISWDHAGHELDAAIDAAMTPADGGVDSASAQSIRSQIEGGSDGPEWQR